jgi:hypothetical protein
VPQLTYVSGADRHGDKFLSSAIDYHKNWGLKPQSIDSMEDILDDLGKKTGGLSRIRIVTHALEDNLFMALFEGGAPGIEGATLKAIAEGEATLLNQLVGPATALTVDDVLKVLRRDNPDVLVPFGLASDPPTGVVQELMLRSATLLMLTKAAGDPTQIAVMKTAITAILPDVRRRAARPKPGGAGVTAAQALALQDAIVALNSITFPAFAPTAASIAPIQEANVAFARGFSKKMAKVRPRFSSSSWIDIRGCKVGATPGYLDAVSEFFGVAGKTPHVSGPDWFQSFPVLSYTGIDDSNIAKAAGEPGVAPALDHWAGVTGMTAKISKATGTEAKLKLYLAAGLVLPVAEPSIGTFRLFVQESLKKKAFDKWLSSQWSKAAPGLKHMRDEGLDSGDARQAAVLSEKMDLGSPMVLSPDPEYKAHIKEI